MKYLIIFVLFLSSLTGVGYYLYTYDKKGVVTPEKKIENKIPEHLTAHFWKNITPEILKQKLKTVSNFNEKRPDNEKSMLHLLVTFGQYPEMVKDLIELGVDYNLLDNDKDGDRLTALQRSLVGDKYTDKNQSVSSLKSFANEIVKYSTKVDQVGFMDYKKVTALLLAVGKNSSLELIQSLLEKGADPNFQSDQEGFTPLTIGFILEEVDIPSPELFTLLLKYEADLDIKDNEIKKKIYDYMSQHEQLRNTDLFQKLSQ